MEANDSYQELLKHQTIDSAALAGAATAAAIAVFSVPGPYVPLNAIVGLTLLTILLAYELKRYRRGSQNLAFGAVCALCALLVLGFGREFQLAGWSLDYWTEMERANPPILNVGYWFLSISWLLLTILFTYIGSRNAIRVDSSVVEQAKASTPSDETNTRVPSA